MNPVHKGGLALLATAALAAPAVAPAANPYAGAETGPSSSERPYLLRSQPGVNVTSILTVGDAVNDKPDGTPYRMVGIPDGLGAYDNGDGTFTVLMNHELGAAVGAVRAHGAKGSFVSKWTIRKDDLAVLDGEDLIQEVATWNIGGFYDDPAKGIALARLCSANLAPVSAFYDAASGKGYGGRLFTSGEEAGAEGRGFGHVVDTGTSYQLPALGRFSYENIVAHPSTGEQTLVVSTDDSNPGQVYVYSGRKRAAGNPVERAGLADGRTYGLAVAGMPVEGRSAADAATKRFSLVPLGADGDVRSLTGAQLDAESKSKGVTDFLRPEDGAWDPTDRDVFHFVTTDGFGADRRSRLWKVRFDDVDQPRLGGTVEAVLDGTEGQRMLDNMDTNGRGQSILQEDPGNQDYLAKVRMYYPAQDRQVEIAHHDPARFVPGSPGFLTRDEEASGIIDVSDILGAGWYLGDVQAHYDRGDAELVEGGQLVALHVPAGRVYGGKK